jgi:hypothetical protein
MKKLQLYDTTLRDGAQAEDISFTLEDKLRIAERLDASSPTSRAGRGRTRATRSSSGP